MKRILSYLSIVLLSASVACSDSSEMDKAYNSVITPGFTFGEEEIIAGITPVTFTNTTTAGRDDRFRILLALRLRRRGQLVRGGRSRPDRLQPSGRLHGHPHGMGRRRQPRHDDQNNHRPCGQRAADGRLQLLAPDDQHRHDRDLYGQIDRFRRRNRVARMALPRRHDLDGHQRDLHVRTNGHVQRPADRDR